MSMHAWAGVTACTLPFGIQVNTHGFDSTSEYLLAPCGTIIEPHGRGVPEARLNDRSPRPGLPECGRSPHEGRPGRGERPLSMTSGTPPP